MDTENSSRVIRKKQELMQPKNRGLGKLQYLKVRLKEIEKE